MSSSKRMQRINELLKREIAGLLEKQGFRNSSVLVSVTEVSVSADLRHAAVYVSVLGGGEADRAKVFTELRGRRGEIQNSIAGTVRLKYTPVLHFKSDPRIEAGDRVISMIEEIESDAKGDEEGQ